VLQYNKFALKYLIIVIGLTLLSVACSLYDEDPDAFYASNFKSCVYYKTPKVLRSAGKYCTVYVEESYSAQISDSAIAGIIDEFDNKIYEQVCNKFGAVSDVDNDQKITIFILDIQDSYSSTRSYYAGYFDYRQLLNVRSSNKKDMIYMDCNPTKIGSLLFNYTLAHELQHLINYNKNVFLEQGEMQDAWINEGLSTAAEHVYLEKPVPGRVNHYNTDPGFYLTQGQGFLSWGTGDKMYGYYTAAYLFFQWLRIHSDPGPNIYKDIIDHRATDYLAVIDTVRKHLTQYYNSETSWKEILRDWYIANIFNDAGGLYGYNGEIILNEHLLNTAPNYSRDYPEKNLHLYAGEGVYLAINNPVKMEVSGGSVDYVGLSRASKTRVDDVGPEYSGDYLLCFNFSWDANIAQDTAPLPSLAISPAISRSYSRLFDDSIDSQESFPIDVMIDANGFPLFDEIGKKIK
jgi:hypothetical protein